MHNDPFNYKKKKPVRQIYIFHKYPGRTMSVMSAQLANELLGDSNELGITWVAIFCI